MATKKEAKRIIRRYLTGTNTGAERHLVEHFFLEYLKKENTLPPADQLPRIIAEMRQTVSEGTGVTLRPPGPAILLHPLVRLLGAAAVILAFHIAYYFLYVPRPVDRDGKGSVIQLTPIPEGHRHASLLRPDSTEIPLRADESIIYANDNGIRYADGTYLVHDDPPFHSREVYAIRTPAGGQYDVVLPDGSQVRLNAGSTLHFPIHFHDGMRHIAIEGEGYFTVTQYRSLFRSTPFVVGARGQYVQVLGTEFNISAYPDETEVKTTLYSGSLRVHAERGGDLLLEPGEQATLDQQGRLTKRTADTGQGESWQTGYIDLHGKSLRQIVRELARWYGLEVVYIHSVDREGYTGAIPLSGKPADALQALSDEHISLHVEDGRKLIVKRTN